MPQWMSHLISKNYYTYGGYGICENSFHVNFSNTGRTCTYMRKYPSPPRQRWYLQPVAIIGREYIHILMYVNKEVAKIWQRKEGRWKIRRKRKARSQKHPDRQQLPANRVCGVYVHRNDISISKEMSSWYFGLYFFCLFEAGAPKFKAVYTSTTTSVF
jgi:hypothetical protein